MTGALVLGGTQGLGLAIAERLAAGGRRIVVTGRVGAKGGAAAQAAGLGFRALDPGDIPAVIDTAAAADSDLAGLSALVVAGALTDRGSMCDTTPELWDRMFAANAKGPFVALQAFANACVAAGRPGRAVTILTMAARVGRSFLAPCAAARAALTAVARNANAFRRDRIRINRINCGWMDTPGEDVIQRKSPSAGDDWRAKAEAAQPFGRLVKPARVAALAAFLLSDASGVMTGSSVDLDQNVSGAHPG
jgi:NAD(P)-dependent dehydrogenase (short-subunit alcohol dehydrogenase family)